MLLGLPQGDRLVTGLVWSGWEIHASHPGRVGKNRTGASPWQGDAGREGAGGTGGQCGAAIAAAADFRFFAMRRLIISTKSEKPMAK